VLSRIARPVAVCLIMPSFWIEEVPVMVMATLLPLTCKLPVELDQARAAMESLCGGDGAGDWVRAGHELGSPRGRSEKSQTTREKSR
jgi:hypothetical protein